MSGEHGARAGWAAPALAVAAGLLVLGGTTAEWIVAETGRDIGGVEVTDTAARTGAELQPTLLLVGVALLLAAALLGFVRGTARRVLGGIAVVASAAGAALGVAGILRAGEFDGVVQTAAWLPVIGAAVGTAAGVVAARSPGRRAGLPARYDLPAGDDPPAGGVRGQRAEGAASEERAEWDLAADDDESV